MRIVRLLLCALATATLPAHADVCKLGATPPSPHTATCNGKTTCALDDLLELKAGANGGQLGTVHVCVEDAAPGVLLSKLVELKQTAFSFALGRQVETWLPAKPEDGKPQSIPKLFTNVRTGGLPVRVVFTDDQGQHTSHLLDLDIGKLWSSGKLMPHIASAQCEDDRPCRFRDTLRLRFQKDHYEAWMAYAKPDATKLTLVIDGIRMAGLAAVPSVDKKGFDFHLTRDPDKAQQVLAWASVLARLGDEGGGLIVGLADDKGAVATSDQPVQFGYQASFPWALCLLTAALLGWLMLSGTAGHHHWLWLRDASPIHGDAAIAQRMTFSLGRCQMFVWTLVIVVCYGYIFASTGDGNSFNGTAFALMGISAGTALGSVAAAAYPEPIKTLIDDYKKLPAPTTPAQQKALLDKIGSSHWWTDLTSEDAERTGLHRLQNIVFTVILVGIFLYMVFSERTMPELSTTQLALLGISSGAYIGFKASGK